jgi:DNA-binding FadR family transcriptional regulator
VAKDKKGGSETSVRWPGFVLFDVSFFVALVQQVNNKLLMLTFMLIGFHIERNGARGFF